MMKGMASPALLWSEAEVDAVACDKGEIVTYSGLPLLLARLVEYLGASREGCVKERVVDKPLASFGCN